jgi:Mg2+ and Co2+ transporter CorA
MKHFKILLFTVATSVFAASTFAAPELTPEQSLEVRKAVVAWLECEECTDGELDRLARYGELAVPTLGAVLERGPSPATLENYRLHLESSYRKLVEYSRTHDDVKIDQSEDEYVKQYLENYQAHFAVRSALALRKLGGVQARTILEAASKRKMRDDVNAVVQDSLKAISR